MDFPGSLNPKFVLCVFGHDKINRRFVIKTNMSDGSTALRYIFTGYCGIPSPGNIVFDLYFHGLIFSASDGFKGKRQIMIAFKFEITASYRFVEVVNKTVGSSITD